jgi:hypothetical protein
MSSAMETFMLRHFKVSYSSDELTRLRAILKVDENADLSAILTRARAILKVDENADLSAIKSAFKRMSKILHPDKNINRVFEATEEFQHLNNAYDIWRPQIDVLGNIREHLLRHVADTYDSSFSNPDCRSLTVEKVTDLLMEPIERQLFNVSMFITLLDGTMDYYTATCIYPEFNHVVKKLLFGHWLFPRIRKLVDDDNLSCKITGMLIEHPDDFRNMVSPDSLQHWVCESISILLQNMSSHSFDEDMLRGIDKILNYKVVFATKKIQRAWRAHRAHQLTSVVPDAYRLINSIFGDDTRFADFLTTSRGPKTHVLSTRRFCSAKCFTRQCGNPTCAKGSNLRGKSYHWLVKDVCEYDSTRRSDMADLMMGLYYFVSYEQTFQRRYQPTQFNITSDPHIMSAFQQVGRLVKEAVDSAPRGQLIHNRRLVLASSMILALVEFIRSIPRAKFSFQGLVDDLRRATWDLMPDEVLDEHFALFGSSRLTAQPGRHHDSTHGTRPHGKPSQAQRPRPQVRRPQAQPSQEVPLQAFMSKGKRPQGHRS